MQIAQPISSPSAPATARVADVVSTVLTHHVSQPGRDATFGPWPTWVDPAVRDRLATLGVPRLWSHQTRAADLVWHGQDVVVATGTASGKSLAYQLPALTWSRRSTPRRRATTLYLAPTKALAADQASTLERLAVPDVRAAVVDGDSTRQERDWARRHADLVLTNPDMLHRSLLPGHRRWSELLAGLQMIVVDESHHYRGLFGSHVAWVLRRLDRLAAYYGARPRMVLLSASMAEPALTAQSLTGRSVVAVREDGSPRGATDILLLDTALDPDRDGPQEWSARLLGRLVSGRHQTIAFVRSRRGTEAVAARAAGALQRLGAPATVAAYRGGYLPEERRALERALRSGELTGVAATNALELGVDIPGVDAVVVGGWPGTRAAFWQQAGRAGRDGRAALAVFVAGADPLERYVATHPEVLIGAPLERTVIDPDNPHVVQPHLCAAAAELPVRRDEMASLGRGVEQVAARLTADGTLRRRADGWYWPRRDRPADRTDIRGSGGPAVRLVEQDTGRLLGTVDRARAPATVHPGAVYVHQGAMFVVTDLDPDEAVALMIAAEPEYDTQARSVSTVRILDQTHGMSWGPARLCLGTVDVTSTVVAYQKRHRDTGSVIEQVPLQMPEQRLRTTGVWWTLPDEVVATAGLHPRRVPGAAHAAEHASIGLLPLFASCDRWDVGGVSAARHPDTDRLTVVVHDAHPGGAGFAARGYQAASRWLAATRDVVAGCDCAQGCPSCVQSPKCGNGNAPLDKDGALTLLSTLLEHSTPATDGDLPTRRLVRRRGSRDPAG